MSATKEQRAMMAADLSFRAVALLLRGDRESALDVLEQARVLALPQRIDPVGDYREGLRSAGAHFDDIDAACAAIGRGEHPENSLPGRVAALRASAQREIDRSAYSTAKAEALGKKFAASDVLEMLGCEVTP